MENFTPTHYTLECVATGRQFEDEGWMLDDPCCKIPSMIRTRYAVRQIDVRPDSYGFYWAGAVSDGTNVYFGSDNGLLRLSGEHEIAASPRCRCGASAGAGGWQWPGKSG